jgi:hypothetical protein
VHLSRLGKADGFAREPLDPRAQRQVLPFNLLRIALAGAMDFGDEIPFVGPP